MSTNAVKRLFVAKIGRAAVLGLLLGLGLHCSSDPISIIQPNQPSGSGGAGGGDDTGFLVQALLHGEELPKFVAPLPTFERAKGASLDVDMVEYQQRILPDSVYENLPEPYRQGTYQWGYKVGESAPHFPATTIEAVRGTPTKIRYQNHLGSAKTQPFLARYLLTDQSVHWADPTGRSKALGCHKGPPLPSECVDNYVGPTPAVVHMHGAEVASESDGHPDAWFTPSDDSGSPQHKGPGFVSLESTYPNDQQATALWFHDHTLGRVRLNVYAGLAGMYLLRDARDTGKADNPVGLPAGEFEHELAIADRQFDVNGQLYFPAGLPGNPTGINGPPPNPDHHPYWNPEFFGDVITVNGRSWPYLEVEPRRYRFRVLDASSARFYRMAFVDAGNRAATGPAIWQIGSDGGLFDRPVRHDDGNNPFMGDPLFLAPGERADIIVDFSGFEGKTLRLINDAPAPFPSGDPPNPGTTGQVLEVRVKAKASGKDMSLDPSSPTAKLRAEPIVDIKPTAAHPADVRRQLVLVEVEGPGGPMEVLLNNSHWDGMRAGSDQSIPDSMDSGRGVSSTELPRIGSTEIWEIANLTEDAHPIHLHLAQFQAIESQPLRAFNEEGDTAYESDWIAAFPGGTAHGKSFPKGVFIPGFGPPNEYAKPNSAGALGGNPGFEAKYFDGPPLPMSAADSGWKDTLKVMPKRVTRLAVRWAPQGLAVAAVKPGAAKLFSFDPTSGGPGYVWHCHILDHEDNEMMRPMLIQP
jgi:FtsP/CotA-like multicopper oxidase with cupredoxin domain